MFVFVFVIFFERFLILVFFEDDEVLGVVLILIVEGVVFIFDLIWVGFLIVSINFLKIFVDELLFGDINLED